MTQDPTGIQLGHGHLEGVDAAPDQGERFLTLLTHRGVVIEEILSSTAPAAGEQVQGHHEWVVLLDGGAILDVAGTSLSMGPGDHLTIPAGTPHRVLSTLQGTRWLAVHIGADVDGSD